MLMNKVVILLCVGKFRNQRKWRKHQLVAFVIIFFSSWKTCLTVEKIQFYMIVTLKTHHSAAAVVRLAPLRKDY